MNDEKRRELLEGIKRGRTWPRLWFVVVLLATAGVLSEGVHRFAQGRGSLLSAATLSVMVFIFAVAVMALLMQEIGQRFSDLVELLGEDEPKP